MTKMKKTELVWQGKFEKSGLSKEVDKKDLPFQIIESINSSRSEKEKKSTFPKNLYEYFIETEGGNLKEEWVNKLIWGDNKLVMSSLLNNYSGSINLIYIDPPFASGSDFSFEAEIGESGESVCKQRSSIEEKVYRDTWGKDISAYLDMMRGSLILSRELLSDKGIILIHLDRRAVSHVKLIADEIFGDGGPKNDKAGFKGEIIWRYYMGGKARNFPGRKHDNILVYTKGDEWTYNSIKVKRRLGYVPGLPNTDSSGKEIVSTIGKDEAGYFSLVSLDDVWDISGVFNMSNEFTGFPTQKPLELLDRILDVFSNKGDLVADFFSGSGTTCVSAEKSGRRWIGCDLSKWGIHTSRKRLQELKTCSPFEILNLGKYERQYWQRAMFNASGDIEQTEFQYIAFILKLYHAAPISGMQFIHGKKSDALVHVGTVDSPVTIEEINLCIDETKNLRQKKLHVLGWEWEMGLNDLMISEARTHGIDLSLLSIPREVMEQTGDDNDDVMFFELAHIETDIELLAGKKIRLKLTDFAIASFDFIPSDLRQKVEKWSDYIDYWAVDWNFSNDTFMNGWVSYRTKKNRVLVLSSEIHQYAAAGKYNVLVKVIDIFGNDTSTLYPVEVN